MQDITAKLICANIGIAVASVIFGLISGKEKPWDWAFNQTFAASAGFWLAAWVIWGWL
jgi:hypothetical protein